MEARELAEASHCAVCREHFIESSGGIPLLYRVTVTRFGVDAAAVRRHHGLSMFLGSSVLAEVMGPGGDLAKPITGPLTVTVCESCAMSDHPVMIARLIEIAVEQRAKKQKAKAKPEPEPEAVAEPAEPAR